MRDLESHPPTEPALCQRSVDDAPRTPAGGDEGMRQRDKGLERETLPDLRMIGTHEADEPFFNDPLRVGARQRPEGADRVDDHVEPPFGKIVAGTAARTQDSDVDAGSFLPDAL